MAGSTTEDSERLVRHGKRGTAEAASRDGAAAQEPGGEDAAKAREPGLAVKPARPVLSLRPRT